MLSAGYGFADPAVMLGAALEPDPFGLLGTKPPRTTTRRSRW